MTSHLAGWIQRLRPKREVWIETQELQKHLAKVEEVLVADVRGPDEFEGPLGHVPGARNIPLDEVPQRIGEFEPAREHRIVLVCQTDKRSVSAAQLLRQRGFPDVCVLRGGMVKWNEEGLAIERNSARET